MSISVNSIDVPTLDEEHKPEIGTKWQSDEDWKEDLENLLEDQTELEYDFLFSIPFSHKEDVDGNAEEGIKALEEDYETQARAELHESSGNSYAISRPIVDFSVDFDSEYVSAIEEFASTLSDLGDYNLESVRFEASAEAGSASDALEQFNQSGKLFLNYENFGLEFSEGSGDGTAAYLNECREFGTEAPESLERDWKKAIYETEQVAKAKGYTDQMP